MDTELNRKKESVLFMRGCVVCKRVPSFSVVKNFDVIKQTLHCLSPALVTIMVGPFTLQSTEETFGNSIVVAVAFTAHAAEHTMIIELFLVIK